MQTHWNPLGAPMIAVFVVLGLLIGFLVLLWWSQERILFQPPRFDEASIESGRVDYKASDGQQLIGFVVGDPRAASGVLIGFHGNADLAVWQLDWAREVERHSGHAVLLAEYRGYMSLAGFPTYENTKLDARAAYDYLVSELGVDSTRIAYFGHSLGSAIATELAEVHPPKALLLQSPFSSAQAMARLIISRPVVVAWKAFSRIHFDTEQAVSRLDVPISVAHGKRDRLVPFRMGVGVYEAAKRKGQFLLVDGAGHNDVADVAGKEYWKWITAALTTGR
jgi:pimeloyl-ACP methyl ester carboxylesterase